MQKGYKHTPEAIQKMKKAAYSRDNKPRLAALPKGKKHWNWTATPNKLTLHRRLHRKYGAASQFKCHDCPKQAKDYSNETGKYTDDIADYRPRCRSCHVKRDKNWIKKK